MKQTSRKSKKTLHDSAIESYEKQLYDYKQLLEISKAYFLFLSTLL